VPAPERAALQRELWTRPASHRGRADAASANHPARACLPPAAGSFDGGARHLEGCGVQGDLVCSEVFELLPKYVDLILATGDASRSQLGQPAEALPQVAHLSSSARSAPKRTRRCSRSNDPRGKIQRSPASNACQEAREAVSRRSVSRSDAS
jgi:hypothetical protein